MLEVGDYAVARNKYRPGKVEVLWIAESPPSSQGFFYFEKTTGKDHLFRETMKAVGIWPENFPMHKGMDKRPYLNKFESKDYFLIDTCELPVDKLDDARRLQEIRKGALRITGEVRALEPKRVLIVKANVFGPVRDALEKAGLGGRILNKQPIPFPSHGWQSKYRSKVRQLIRSE
jgi:hypothetical protein